MNKFEQVLNRNRKVVFSSLLFVILIIAIFVGIVYINQRSQYEDFLIKKRLIDNFSTSIESEVVGHQQVAIEISELVEGSYIDIYIDGEKSKTVFNEQGESLSTTIELPHEDLAYKITAKQIIEFRDETVESGFSDTVQITLDTTAPEGSIRFLSAIPDETNESQLAVSFQITTDTENSTLVIKIGSNTKELGISETSTTLNLSEGSNSLRFYLIDEAGNASDPLYEQLISVDRTAPKISTSIFFCGMSQAAYQEEICITTGEFSGPLYGTAYAPIEGETYGDLEWVTVNGYSIDIKADGSINQRVALYVSPGDNVYDVEAMDIFGNKGYGTVSVSWSSDEDRERDEFNDRLDDLESMIEDLE